MWGAHPNPGLSPLGHSQALAVAARLAGFGARELLTSPLARCRETARPTETATGHNALVNEAVAEIPVPIAVSDHRAWLMAVMSGNWSDDHVEESLRTWRGGIGHALISLKRDTLIFSHFVAINTAVGLAMGSDKVTNFKPGHASVTILESSKSTLTVVELGQEAVITLA